MHSNIKKILIYLNNKNFKLHLRLKTPRVKYIQLESSYLNFVGLEIRYNYFASFGKLKQRGKA